MFKNFTHNILKGFFFKAAILLVFLQPFSASFSQTVLYSYRDTTWDEPTAWTTDPSGMSLTGSRIPVSNDTLVILNGITIILDDNVGTTNHVIVIESGGILDLAGYRFTSTLVSLSGEGTLKINSANAGTLNFPAVTTNNFITAAGGTTVYYNVTGTLPATVASYNNLTLLKSDDNATSYTTTLGSNLTVYGNLTLFRSQGSGNTILTIGNSATARSLTVNGNVQIDEGGILNVGNFNAIHPITLNGNLTNNGSIDLSNSLQYATSNNGAATVTFAGNTNNTLFCGGPSDFYRLILNKGTDATYTLTASSTDANYFKLFGPVTATGGDWSTLPLVIQNGTLKLMNQINIPILGKNTGAGAIRQFNIPSTGCLHIAGATVSTSDVAGLESGITINGSFIIEQGSFTTPVGTSGFSYYGSGSGSIRIYGGIVNTTQLRQLDANGMFSYIQTGGEFKITGASDTRGTSAVFALPDPNFYFQMSGGLIYIASVNTAATNGINIRSSSSNYNVSGGDIYIVRPNQPDDQADFHIYSSVPFYNLTLKDTTLAGSENFVLKNHLTVINNVTITGLSLDAAGFNVCIGGNFNISNAGATYTPGDNRTTFNGSGAQTFTVNGTIGSGGLYRLAVEKSAGILAMSGANVTIRDSFILSNGTLDDGGATINVHGHIYNAGIHTGSGKITLNGTAPQIISGNAFGVFGNLELNNANAAAAPVSLTATTRVNGTLTLTANKIFHIADQNLIIGPSGSISGTMSATCFISTNGDVGNGGITKYFPSAGYPYSFTYPVGAPSVGHAAAAWTPATITINTTPTTPGAITVIPVGIEQPNVTMAGKNRSLTYFWRTKSSGFVLGSATLTQTYTYNNDDIISGGNIDEAGYVAARYSLSSYTWAKGNTATVNEGTNVITFSGPAFNTTIDGDYTAGDDNPIDPFGAVSVFYSYTNNGTYGAKATWSTTGHTGVQTVPGNAPGQYDPVIIGNGHTIIVGSNGEMAGSLQIASNSTLDCGTRTGLVFNTVSAHSTGFGKIRISSTAATAVFPSGDFSQFIGPNGGTVEYYTPAASSFAIPTTSASALPLISYRNLILTPATGTTITMPDQNLTIYGDFTSQGAGTGAVYLNTASAKTLNVLGNLLVTSGNLQFRNGTAQTLVVNGNVTIGGTFDVQAAGATANSMTVYGNLTNNGTLNFNNSSYCNLSFAGTTNASLTGTGNTTLRNLNINKGSSQATTLTVNVSGATFSTPSDNWLTLQNGTFKFMRSGSLNISTASPFTIPASSCLHIENATATVNIGTGGSSTNSADLLLHGKLNLVNGTVNVGTTGNNFNNDIEYSASGASEINIANGSLLVNGQIRRNASGTAGTLMYTQSGGTVTINGANALATRAKLEIANDGSIFNMSNGTLNIVRGGGTTFGDLYLRPASSSVTGGTIVFSKDVPFSAQSYTLDATATLNNLTITGTPGNDATVGLSVNPLSINGVLTLNNNSILNANSLNVSLKNNFINNGTYSPGTNLTTFNGVNQTLSGTSATTFYDLTSSATNSLTLSQNITVNRNLTITTGTLSNGTYTMNVKGNVANNGIISGDAATGGLKFNGTTLQNISGAGVYGRIELDNPAGAKILNNITLNQNFIFTNGNLDINQYLLTLGLNANLSGFGSTRMIICDGVSGTNSGVSKVIKTAASSMTFPIGVSGKYTPFYYNFTANATQGTLLIKPVNSTHLSILDANNALSYYWQVTSSGLSGVSGSVQLTYNITDVKTTASYTEANYYAGTLYNSAWSKYDSTFVNEVAHRIELSYLGVNTISGDYTAGLDAAIPSTMAVFTSAGSGNWNNPAIWWRSGESGPGVNVPSSGPVGQNVVIRASDVISTNGNSRNAYNTTIYGRLNVGSTFGHNLGYVSGTGTLSVTSTTLPAGKYTDFFSCSGGTLEYGGNTDYTMSLIPTVIKKLSLVGTGRRILPNKNIIICDSLIINGPTLDNSVNNIQITLYNTMKRFAGAFTSGSGANATIVFGGTSPQTISGGFTGVNALNNLRINNPAGLTLDGAVDVKNILTLSNGQITTSTANILTLINTTSTCSPAGGSSSSFINGPMTKKMNVGENFTFPVGDENRLGNISVLNPEAAILQWQAEYFYDNPAEAPIPMDVASVTSPIEIVSSTEYWRVKRMDGAAGSANIRIRWDVSSDISPVTTGNINNIRITQWGGPWQEVGNTTSGNSSSGTVETTAKINLLNEKFFTLGTTTSALAPTAALSGGGTYCSGSPVNPLTVSFTGTGPWEFVYSKDGTPVDTITTSSNPYSLAVGSGGTYTLDSLTGGTAHGSAIITINSLPAVTAANNGPVCTGNPLELTGGPAGMTSYSWTGPNTYGSSQQSPIVSTSSTLAMAGVYTLTVVDGNSCTNSITTTPVINETPGISVHPAGVSICAGANTNINITASGTALTYQWQEMIPAGAWVNLANGGVYSGVNTAILTLTGVPSGMTGNQYRCIITGTCSTITSNAATLVVNTLNTPVFTLGATSARCQGAGTVYYNAIAVGSVQNVSLTDLVGVVASGSDLTKTATAGWGNAGAASVNQVTNNSFAYTIVAETNTHRMFGLSSSNANANYTSIQYAIHLTDAGGLQIFESGASRGVFGTYVNGDSLKIAVESNVIKYYKNSTFLYQSTVVPTLPLIVDVALYSANSTLKSITFNSLTYSLDAASLAGGNTINFTSGAVTYAAGWNSTSTITARAEGCGGPLLTSHTVIIKASPVITSQPLNTRICETTNTALSITASGTELTYQWQEKVGAGAWTNLVNGGAYSTVTTATLNLSNVPFSMNGNQYRCVVSNGCNPDAISSAAVLVVNPVTGIPVFSAGANSDRCQGAGTLHYSAVAAGVVQSASLTDLIGVTASGNDLIKTAADAWGNAGAASLNQINNNHYVSTIVAEINKHRMFGLSNTNPDANYISIKYAIYLSNTGSLQIYESNILRGNFGTYATGDTLKIAVLSNVVKYYKNNTLLYTSAVAPTLPLIIDVALYTLGSTLNNITINSLTYSLDAASIVGGNSINALSGAVTYAAGWSGTSTITARAEGCGGPLTATHAVSTNTPPVITVHPSASITCSGSNTTFSVTATGAGLTYQWEENQGSGWNALANVGVYSNVTSATMTITAVPVSMNGYQYRCVVSGTCVPSVTSNAASLTVNALPAITSQPLASVICEETNTFFSITATGTAITYQWEENRGLGWNALANGGVYSNVTTATMTITAATIGMNGYQYRCVVSGTCSPAATSDAVGLTVYQLPVSEPVQHIQNNY